ncbi:MAG: hypothetical protein U0586_04250 [Candidatus Brocadiaceae bacterium]
MAKLDAQRQVHFTMTTTCSVLSKRIIRVIARVFSEAISPHL